MKSRTINQMQMPTLLIVQALLLGTSLPLWSQETGSVLNGIVKDASGGVIAGATVTITNKVTGRVFTMQTGMDGLYIARDLQPGRYTVRFEMTGFGPVEVADVNLLLGKTLKVDGTLPVAPVQQAVSVIETAPLIDLSSTAVTHHVPAEEFDRIPRGRSFQSLLALSPSVNAGERFVEGGFQVNGASGAENQFVIDGVPTNSVIHGQGRQGAVFEFLQEVQVKTGGIEAEYGGALGGVLSAVTKSGGNAFHGDIHYYFSGNGISAGPVKRLVLDPIDEAKPVTYFQDDKQESNRHELGGSLGGYFIKNKLWFFAAASPRWIRRENDYFLGRERATGSLKNERLDQNLFAKVSFDPIPRLRTSFSWLNTTIASSGTLPGYNWERNQVTFPIESLPFRQRLGFFQPQSSYTGSVDFLPTNKMIFSVRGGRYWDNYKDTGFPNQSAVEYATSAFDLPPELLANVAPALRQGRLYSNIPRRDYSFFDIATRSFVQADYGVFASLWGDHDLKMGVGAQKNVNKVDKAYAEGGYVEVFWNRAFQSSVPGSPCARPNPPCRGSYGIYRVHDLGTRGSAGGSITNLYIQDKWRIHPRLTLSLGLRAERELFPSFRRDILDPAFQFGFGDKVAPRIGLSYDALGNGNLKLSFSWGRFYDWVKYELARGTFGGDFWRIYYRSLDTPDVLSLSGTNRAGQDLWNPAVPNSFRDFRVPAFSKECSPQQLESCAVDPGLRPMSTDLLNFTAEYQLTPQTVFRASYVHNDLRRTVEDLGVNVEGDIHYFYANPGEGIAKITPPSGDKTAPFATPKPMRTYDAMELSLNRRFANRWFISGSYVLSRLYGNYSGISSSDEIHPPGTGLASGVAQQQGTEVWRPGGNANLYFDLDEMMFDSHGKLLQGRLATDRPHVLKLYGSYLLPGGTEVGGFFSASSGTPVSTIAMSEHWSEIFVEGRGDLGRTDVLSQTDLLVAHEFNVAEGKKLRFEFNMINLFNQKTPRYKYNYLNFYRRDGALMDLSEVDLRKGYDYKEQLAATDLGAKALDPRFGNKDLFNDGFAGRFGIKFTF